jgi:hypothetical protein
MGGEMHGTSHSEPNRRPSDEKGLPSRCSYTQSSSGEVFRSHVTGEGWMWPEESRLCYYKQLNSPDICSVVFSIWTSCDVKCSLLSKLAREENPEHSRPFLSSPVKQVYLLRRFKSSFLGSWPHYHSSILPCVHPGPRNFS